MSFQQGLSGLAAAAKNLDVIGNNISNSNTVGAKQSRAEFADVYANSLYGAGSQPVGIGVAVAAIATQFSQGDLSPTQNPLDVAINGSGFFRVSQNGAIAYTRNGQFKLDKEGFLVNAQGSKVTGFPADPITGRISTGAPTDIKLNLGDVQPRPTTQGALSINLNAEAASVGANNFNLSNIQANQYTNSTTINVYDSLGQDHALTMYIRKIDATSTPTPPTGAGVPVSAATNSWEVVGVLNGVVVSGASQVLSFNTDGSLAGITSGGTFSAADKALNFSANLGPAAGTLAFTLDVSKLTQYGAPFGVTEMTQDGNSSGRLAGFAIDASGLIRGRYSNGQTRDLAQFALANFVNPQGLVPLGGNAYAESGASGQPLVGPPATGSLGAITSGAVENSNVDLTAELVSMITAQRVYQANAQTIKTQDQVMQTLVNLR